MSGYTDEGMTTEEYRKALIQIIGCGRGLDAIKDLASEMQKRNNLFFKMYDDATARLTAIGKIANSSQTPKQKIAGIKPLADMRGDTDGK